MSCCVPRAPARSALLPSTRRGVPRSDGFSSRAWSSVREDWGEEQEEQAERGNHYDRTGGAACVAEGGRS